MMQMAPGIGWLQASYCSCIAALATWNEPFDFIGVPAAVIFMAFAGAAAGLIAQPPKATRKVMLLQTLAYTFFSAVSTVTLAQLPLTHFVTDIAAPVAGLLAFFAQVLIPAVSKRLPREIENRGSTNGNDGGAS